MSKWFRIEEEKLEKTPEGFEIAARELTLSEELLKDVPTNCRRWKPEDVRKWLAEVFPGAKDLTKYQKSFVEAGMDGPALLSATDNVLIKLGIDQDIHLPKIKLVIKQLVEYQKRLDKEEEEGRTADDNNFFELEKKMTTLLSKYPDYALPYKLENWTELDVFIFFKRHSDQEFADLFIHKIARNKFSGTDLLELKDGKKEMWLKREKIEKRAGERLKLEIKSLQVKMDNFIKRETDERMRKLQTGLPPLISEKLVVTGKELGAGSQGTVYKATYDKKTVALKIPNDSSKNKDLLYEAALLKKASGPGVIQLIAVDAATHSPRMATEFLVKGSLEKELFDGLNEEPESIFCAKNVRNKMDEADGIQDPVLFHMVRIARDVASALHRIHQAGILHLDLSARNIFMDNFKRPKIGDFGMAVLETDMLTLYNEDTEFGVKKESLLISEIVKNKYKIPLSNRPIAWMPESIVINEDHPLFDRRVDVFSLGCVFYELATKRNPHYDLAKEKDAIIQRKRDGQGNPSLPIDLDPKFASLIVACWDMDAQIPLSTLVTELSRYHKELAFGKKAENAEYSEVKKLTAEGSQQFPLNQDSLVKAMTGAMNYRDHSTLLYCLKSLNVIGKHEDIINALIQCIESIGKLSLDPHSDIGDGDLWFALLEGVMTAAKISMEIEELTALNIKKILVSSLATIASIIEMNESKIEENVRQIEELQLFDFVFDLFNKFSEDPIVMAGVMGVIKSIAVIKALDGGDELSDTFYEKNAISQILKCIQTHKENARTLICCVQSLGAFPLYQIINPMMLQVPSLDSNALRENWKRVFSTVFQIVEMCRENGFPVEKELLLQTVLLMLSRECTENAVDQESVERFLYSVTPDMIRTLFAVIRQYPNSFRMQEGAIGLLAHISLTGMRELQLEHFDEGQFQVNQMAVVTGGYNYFVVKETVPLLTPFEERARVILQEDPDLRLLVAAMNRFRENDQIAIAIKASDKMLRQRSGYLKSNVYSFSSTSIVSSTTASTTMSSMSSRRGSAMTGKAGASTTMMKASATAMMGNRGAAGAGRFNSSAEKTSYVDDDGVEISAANLQKSVAVILGQLCDVEDGTQHQLTRSTYNELFIFAFQKYINDVQLIKFGCYAIFSIARGNSIHQRSFRELNILKEMRMVFSEHKSESSIADAIVMVFLGLLEAPKVHHLEMTKWVPDTASDGYLFADKISELKHNVFGSDHFDFHQLSFQIAIHMFKVENFHLAGNFLRLIGLILVWKPALLEVWWTPELKIVSLLSEEVANVLKDKEINPDGGFVDLKSDEYSRNIIRKMLLDVEIHLASNNQINEQLNRHQSNNKKLQEEMKKKRQDVAQLNGKSGSTKNEAGETVIQIAPSYFEKMKNRWDYGKQLSLYEFVKFTLMNYENFPEVIAPALALVVKMITVTFIPDYKVGADVGYLDHIFLWFYRFFLYQELLPYCLYALKIRSDDPVLIRHSLWLLLIFISERPDGQGLSVSSTLSNVAAENAAELATQGCIEWAIEAIKFFPDYYSIQALAIHFLIWMDNHGRLSNRADFLSALADNLTHIQMLFEEQRGDYSKFYGHFKPLWKECYDTVVMNCNYEYFGDLVVLSQQLLARIGVHLDRFQKSSTSALQPPPKAKQMSRIDPIGAVSPTDTEAYASSKEGPKILLWDQIARPTKVEVSETRMVDSVPMYVIFVTWIDEKEMGASKGIKPSYSNNVISETDWSKYTHHWKISKSYKDFILFQTQILEEMGELTGVFSELIEPERFLFKKSPEANREFFNKWLQELFKIPGSYFHAGIREFLGITGGPSNGVGASADKNLYNLCSTHFKKMLEVAVEKNSQKDSLCIQDLVYDEVAQFLFVACGRFSATLLGSRKVRGKCQLFKVIRQTDQQMSFQLLFSMDFTEGVGKVSWDRQRQLLLVGLVNGIIISYSLSADLDQKNYELTYISEFDFHRSPLLALSFNSITADNSYYIAASTSGRFTLFNLVKGKVDAQLAPSRGYSVVSFAYNFIDKVAFCGTNQGTIIVYNTLRNPPVKQTDLVIGYGGAEEKVKKENKGEITNLEFLHGSKTLIACHWNNIVLFQQPNGSSLYEPLSRIVFREDTTFAYSSFFQYENMFQVFTNQGNMYLYSFEAPKMTKSGETSTLQNDDPLKTTAKNLVSWQNVVHQENAAIRKWLIDKGIKCSLGMKRLDYIKLIETAEPALNSSLILDEVRRKVLIPYPKFFQKIRTSSGERMFARYLDCSAMIEEERLLLFGASKGFLYGYDLHEIYPPAVGCDLEFIRDQRAHFRVRQAAEQDQLLHSLKDDLSSRGKRLQKL